MAQAQAQDLQRLVVSLEARIDKFDKAMAKASGISSRTTKKISKDFADLDARMSRFTGISIAGALGGATIAGAARFARNAIKSLADLGDQAKKTGVEVEELQKLLFAAMQEGVDADTVTKALGKLNLELGEAQNKGNDLGKILKANGIEIKDFAGDGVAAFRAIADLMAAARTDQERALIGQAAFGKGYQELLPLLKGGAEAIKQGEQAAVDWGAVVDKELIAKAQEFDDKWDAAFTTWEMRAKAAAVNAASWFDWVFDSLTPGRIVLDENNVPRILNIGPNRGELERRRRYPPPPIVPKLGTDKEKKFEWPTAGREAIELDDAMDELIRSMDEAREATRGFIGDLVSGLREGLTLTETLGQAFANLADRMVNRLIDMTVDQLLGGGGTAGTGLLGQLLGITLKDQSRLGSGGGDTFDSLAPIPVTSRKLDPLTTTSAHGLTVQQIPGLYPPLGTEIPKTSDEWDPRVWEGVTGSESSDVLSSGSGLDLYAETLIDMAKSAKKAKDATETIADAAGDAAPKVADALPKIADNLGKVAEIVPKLVSNIGTSALLPPIGYSGMNWTSLFTSGLAPVSGGLFGGGRQHGGPVSPGRAYMVGERGPELFMPRTPGIIAPNRGGGATGGGMAVEVIPSKYFDVHVHRAAEGAGARAVNTARRGYPETAARFEKLGTTSR